MPKIPDLKWEVRVAEEEDIPTILDLCYQLSVYEKKEFKGTEELYKKYGFSEDKIFDCLLAENTGEVGPPYLGVALYYYTFSTHTGKATLYLEDIFVLEEYRGRGIGTRLLSELAKIAVEKDCARMDWIVLDWNKPSWGFYKKLGAFPLDEWTVFRMLPPEIKKLAEKL